MRTPALMLSGAVMLILALPVAAQDYGQQSQQPSSSASQQQQPGNSSSYGSQPSQREQAPAARSQPQQQAQSGVRTSTPQQMTFYNVQASDLSASRLIGLNVYNTANESIGEIKDLVLDDGKNLKAVVIGVGGFLGVGERNIALQPASVLIQREADGGERAVVNATKEALENAPEFKLAQAGRSTDQNRTR